MRSRAASTTLSVSGRGMRVSSFRSRTRFRKYAYPRIRCTGSRFVRRETQASYSEACSGVNGSSEAASSARPMPSSSESRTSAEATGSGTPARSSRSAARRAASRRLASPAPARTVLARGSSRFCSELVRPLLGGESLRELLEVAAADLRLTEGAFLLSPLAHLAFQDPGLEYPHCLLLVLELTLLVLAGHDQARWLVRDPDRRVCGVDALAAGTAGAVHVDFEISRIDLDLHILGLGQDGHRRRRGVYTALALGLGHPLDPVRPAFVFEDRVSAVAAYLYGDLLVATDLGRARREGPVLEAETVCVAGVHVVDLACEEGRLITAGAGPDLDYDVFVVVRVAVDELRPDALGEVFDPLFGLPRFGREELALLRVLGLGDEFPRIPLGLHSFEQFSRQLCSAPHPRVFFSDPCVAPLVAIDVRVREFLR